MTRCECSVLQRCCPCAIYALWSHSGHTSIAVFFGEHGAKYSVFGTAPMWTTVFTTSINSGELFKNRSNFGEYFTNIFGQCIYRKIISWTSINCWRKIHAYAWGSKLLKLSFQLLSKFAVNKKKDIRLCMIT